MLSIICIVLAILFFLWMLFDYKTTPIQKEYPKASIKKRNLFSYKTQTHPHHCTYLHNEEGPAVQHLDGYEEYWLWGEKLTKEAWMSWKEKQK